MLDLNDLALFVQVVRNGSFAATARHVGFPSNTISRRIQELEEELGVRLFQRSTRRLSLTAAGESLHEKCAASLDHLIDVSRAALAESQTASGRLRIAAPANFFDFFPMDWVAEFLVKHPRTRIEFLLSDSRADLLADRVDIAFRAGELSDSSYVSRPLLRNGADALVASPQYLTDHGTPQTPKELQNHRCVVAADSSDRATWLLSHAQGHEAVQVDANFMADTAQALRQAALAGIGIALLPVVMVADDIHRGNLMAVLPGWGRKHAGVSMLYPSRTHLPLAASAFMDMVCAKTEMRDAPPI